MDVGLGTAAVVWLLSGVLFWGGFVVLALGFRRVDEYPGPSQSTPESSSPPNRIPSSVQEQVFARTSEK